APVGGVWGSLRVSGIAKSREDLRHLPAARELLALEDVLESTQRRPGGRFAFVVGGVKADQQRHDGQPAGIEQETHEERVGLEEAGERVHMRAPRLGKAR